MKSEKQGISNIESKRSEKSELSSEPSANTSVENTSKENSSHDIALFSSDIKSIFSARCASALSMMTGENFEFRLNKVERVKSEYLDDLSKQSSEDVCAVYLKSEGDLNAAMLIYLEHDNARSLAGRLMGKELADRLDAIGRSSISEVCNILFAGCFLNSVSDLTGLKTFSSIPGMGVGDLRAMVEYPVAEIAESTHEVIAAESELVGQKSGIVLKMLLVVSKEDAKKLSGTSSAMPT
jgi:chemotaxis protein CheY-P-specific phosphatase CheC